jgi:signal peptidase
MFKKVIKIVFNVILHTSLLLILGVLLVTSIQRVRGGQPNVFGYTIYVVQTDSMTGELEVGDVILSKKTDEYEVGSVVTYIATSGVLEGQPITHKIVDIYEENGRQMVQTKGVKAGAPLDTPITGDQIIGVMQTKINVPTKLVTIIRNPAVSFCIIVIPIAIFAGYQIYCLKKDKEEE